MTDADDIRDAAIAAGEEVKRSIVEAVRLADEERAKLTGQVQDDRREDAPPERDLTTNQVQQDRRADEKQNRNNIQQDRRDDDLINRGHIQQDRLFDDAQSRGNIQQDRRDDQGPERTRTADRIRSERLADVQASTDQIQRDRREDEAPRTALELVRADKLTHSIVLQEGIRKVTIWLLVVMVVMASALAFMFDYMQETRARIQRGQDSQEELNENFKEFQTNNQAYLDAHSRTQRLICGWYRANNVPLPDNGDCEGR